MRHISGAKSVFASTVFLTRLHLPPGPLHATSDDLIPEKRRSLQLHRLLPPPFHLLSAVTECAGRSPAVTGPRPASTGPKQASSPPIVVNFFNIVTCGGTLLRSGADPASARTSRTSPALFRLGHARPSSPPSSCAPGTRKFSIFLQISSLRPPQSWRSTESSRNRRQ